MATKGIVRGIVSNLVTVEVDGPVSQNEICYIFYEPGETSFGKQRCRKSPNDTKPDMIRTLLTNMPSNNSIE